MRHLPLSRSPRTTPVRPFFARSLLSGAAAAALASSLLSGCWLDDDTKDASTPPEEPPPAATSSVTVTPSLGLVAQADAKVDCAPTGATLGTGSTGSSGVVTLTATGSCAGPLVVTISGRSDNTSTYFDEGLGTQLPFPAGSSLRAVVPALSNPLAVAVTPLTEIATRQALRAAGSVGALTAAQVSAANAAVVSQLLGSGVSLDILSAPTLWSASTGAGALGNSAADRHAYYLGGLARLAAGAASPALAITEALATDLADGALDGATGTGYAYTASDLAGQLQTSLRALASFASAELQTAVGVPPVVAVDVTGFSPAHAAAGDTVTLTGSGFDADPFHMQVRFASNLSAEIVSCSATEIVVKVPTGAVTGVITVTHGLSESSDTTATEFIVDPSAPPAAAWTSRASPSSWLLNGLAYGNGVFVAVGYNRTILTSSDGLSWTSRSAPDTDYYDTKAVIWTGSQFVLVGDKVYNSARPAVIATSPDGITWTRRTWTPAIDYDTLIDVGVGGSKLTVVGLNGSLASSTDGGVTWTNEQQPGVAAFSGVAGNDSTRVAVGRNSGYEGMILVDTGGGWTSVSGITRFVPRDVIWAGTQFVAVGGSAAGLGDAVVMTSPDGVNWTRTALPAEVIATGFPLLSAVWTGTRLYATADNLGNRHAIVSSVDGITWAAEYSGQVSGNAVLSGIAASPSRLVTVGGVKSVTLP